MQPKFYVCTMYCGEPDLPHMLRSIADQGMDVVEHKIISYKKEVDAHNELYESFNRAD